MKIKNVRAGVLVVTDAKLRLVPGQELEVDGLTPHMEKLVAGKALVVTDGNAPVATTNAGPAATPTEPSPTKPPKGTRNLDALSKRLNDSTGGNDANANG